MTWSPLIMLTLGFLFNPSTGILIPAPVTQPGAAAALGVPTDLFTTGVPGCVSSTGNAFTYEWNENNTRDLMFCGKGWSTGTNRTIGYSGTCTSPSGTGYFTVYGWTRNPLIEYYVVESYGSINPSSGASRIGTVTCNGHTYNVLQTTRVNQPSMDGTQTYRQLWSVKQNSHTAGAVNGAVDMGCHFSAWDSMNPIKLGAHAYQLLGVAAYFGSGSAAITTT